MIRQFIRLFENPGSIRTGKKQMLRSGISDPRNKTLMKMFNMIGIGERAGSGIPDIYQVWGNYKLIRKYLKKNGWSKTVDIASAIALRYIGFLDS